MKIAVNGNIIDTKDIYKITPIEKIDRSFTIISFNNYEINIRLDFFDVMEELYHRKSQYNTSQMIDVNNTIYNRLNTLRDKVIKVWSEDQSDIPQFNL